MLKRLRILIALPIAAALLAAVAARPAHATEPTVVQVTLSEFKVEMSPATIPVGVPVRFEVTNVGKIQHEFVVEKAGAVDDSLKSDDEGKELESEIEPFNPGETKTLDWTFTEAGAYQAACHLPGHFEAGMKTAFSAAAIVSQAQPAGGANPSANPPQALPTAGGIWTAPNLALAIFGGALVVIGVLGILGFVMRQSDGP